MKHALFLPYIIALALSCSLSSSAFAEESLEIPAPKIKPTQELNTTQPLPPTFTATDGLVLDSEIDKCPQHKRWRIAVAQSGPYPTFRGLFYSLTKYLMQDRLIRYNADFYNGFDTKNRHFNFDEGSNYVELAQRTKGGCIEFIPHGFFNALWSEEIADIHKKQIQTMIAEQQIDMIWAFGTLSGLSLADSSLGVPVLVINASAPTAAGIIGKGEFSNKPFIHVQKEVQRYYSEIAMFHSLFQFKKMGLLLDLSEEDQMAQAYPVLQSVAENHNFKLVPCYGNLMGRNHNESSVDFKKCMDYFATADIDAFLLTVGYRPKFGLYSYLKPLLDRQIPIYSQAGEDDVRHGALLSLSEKDMTQSAYFEANIIKHILHGEDIQTLSQYYSAPLTLTLNLQVARHIEWRPSFEMLVAVDHVLRTIDRR